MFLTPYKNKTLHIRTLFHMIGDMICVFPVLVALSELGKEMFVQVNPCYSDKEDKKLELMKYIATWMPKKYNMTFVPMVANIPSVVFREIGEIYQYSRDYQESYTLKKPLHMTQIHFKRLGLKVPSSPIRPDLEIPYIKVKSYDYLIAPHAFSPQPPEQFPYESWVAIIKALPNRTFGVLGNSDTKEMDLPNAENIFNKPLSEVANIMRRSGPLISPVNGIGHLAFALGTPHILLTNQSDWSLNPDAIAVVKSRPMWYYPPEELLKIINRVESGETGIIVPADFNYRRPKN